MSRFFEDPEYERRLLDDLDRRARRMDAHRRQARRDPSVVERLNDHARRYPYAAPGVLESMARAGVPADSDVAERLAASSGEMNVQQGELSPDGKANASWFRRNVGGPLAAGFRTAIRGLTTAAHGVFHEGVSRPLTAAAEIESGLLEDPSKTFGQFAESYREQGASPAVRAFQAWRTGNGPKGLEDEEFLGAGFVPGGRLWEEHREQLERRPVSGSWEAGRAAIDVYGGDVSMGRAVLANTKVIEPGEAGFDTVSGLLDLAAGLFLDPTAKVGGGISKINRAGRTFGEAADLLPRTRRVLEGAQIVGPRRTTIARDVEDFLVRDTAGQRMVDHLTGVESPSDVWRALGRRVDPQVANRIANARSADETREALRSVLGSSIREKPTAGRLSRGIGRVAAPVLGEQGSIYGAGAGMRHRFADGFRRKGRARLGSMNRLMWADTPGGQINVDDIGLAMREVEDFAKNALLSPEAIRKHLDALTEIDPDDSAKVTAVWNVAKDLMKDVDASLVARGKSGGLARRLTQISDEFETEVRQYFIDELGRPGHFPGAKARATVNGVEEVLPSAHLLTEYMNMHVPLPDARAIRQETSKVFDVLDALHLRNATQVATDVIDHKFMRWWKPLQLLRGAWAVRVVGEEQARMGATGMHSAFNHPLSYVAWMTGKRGDIDMTGSLIKQAQEHTDAMSRSAHWLGTDLPGTVRTGDYVRAFKGDPNHARGWADEITQLATDEVAQRVAGGLREGDIPIMTPRPAAPNMPPLFHGSARAIPGEALAEGGGAAAIDNLFGPGFYTTSSEGIAGTYRRKGAKAGDQAATYGVEWKGSKPPRVLDLETPLPSDANRAVRGLVDDLVAQGQVDESFQSVARVRALLDEGATGSEVHAAFRRLAEDGLEEASGPLARFNQSLNMLGYDALRYQGGKYTWGRSEAHDAFVFLRPENVRIEQQAAARQGMDAVKDWFWQSDFMRQLDQGPARGLLSQSRANADGYIDSVWARINIKTGGAAELRDASGRRVDAAAATPDELANARWSVTRTGDDDLIAGIGQGRVLDVPVHMVEPYDGFADEVGKALSSKRAVAPDVVKVSRELTLSGRRGKRVALDDRYDKVLDTLYHHMMGQHTDRLSRSPVFKQQYWDEAERLLTSMSQPVQDAVFVQARKANLNRDTLSRMGRIVGDPKRTGDVLTDITLADDIAKAYALGQTKKMLYDLSKRSQFADVTRLIFPFAEAFKEVLTNWARIGVQNPQSLERFRQVAMSGFFTEGPFGDEIFAYPGGDMPGLFGGATGAAGGAMVGSMGGPVGALAGGVVGGTLGALAGSQASPDAPGQIDMTGQATGLNLVTQSFLPGFGPMVQMAASAFLPEKPGVWEDIQDLILPYGRSGASETGILESLFPAYMKRGLSAIRDDPEQDRIFGNQVAEIQRMLYASGEYTDENGMIGPEQRQRLVRDSVRHARWLYALRATAQFILPTGPRPQFSADTPEGIVTFQALADEFRAMAEDEEAGGWETALQRFTDRFGLENTLVLQAMTKEKRRRSVGETGVAWERNNPDLVEAFPNTVGWFAPDLDDDPMEYSAYVGQIARGDKVSLTPDEQAQIHNHTLGRAAMAKVDAELGDRTDAGARAYRRDMRLWLKEQYPGFDSTVAKPIRADRDQMIAEFNRAVEHPKLKDTELAKGWRAYMEAREQARARLPEGLTTFKGQGAAHLAAFLRDTGRYLSREHPGFGEVFDRILESELREEEEA